MTLSQLKESILVQGDETTYLWNQPWRRYLVDNLEILVQPLWHLGIEDIVLDGSFCSDKETPGDLDAYFNIELDTTSRTEAIHQLEALAYQLNELSPADGIWNWWEKRPNSKGEMKIEMWHHYSIEIFPNAYGVYAVKGEDGEILKFEEMFRKDKDGIPKGVIKLLKG